MCLKGCDKIPTIQFTYDKNKKCYSHFRSKYGCYCIKMFIRKEVIPDNPYLKESYRRLTEEKKAWKEKYINIQKGVQG